MAYRLTASCFLIVLSLFANGQANEPEDMFCVLEKGTSVFTDRTYSAEEIPTSLQGRKFLHTSIEGYAIECTTPGDLYILTLSHKNPANQSSLLLGRGFEKVDLPEFQFSQGDVHRFFAYRKRLESGEKLAIRKTSVAVLGEGTKIKLLSSGAPDNATIVETPEQASERITRMEKIADHALVPPIVNTSPLPEYSYDQLDYGMTIGIERTPDGRIWVCWVAGGDSPEAFFVLASSDDDGETWSDPRVVLDSHDDDLGAERSILVGNLWSDPKGHLWLFFDQSMDMFDGRAGVWATVCANPDADEPTWSTPKRIWHGVMLNKPTVLSSGEWLLPISLDQRDGFRQFKGCFRELDPLRGANVFSSRDEGKSWERRGAVRFLEPDWHEHMIIEKADGRLWMLARTRRGIMESHSSDQGKTWSKPEASAIKHPVARFFIRRLHSGNLLLVKHGDKIDSHQGRVQLSAWLSDDDGDTWKGGLVLDERSGISYPDGFQAPDGTIYISYDRNRSIDGEILMARFTEEDILTKDFQGPKSKAKILISRPLGLLKKQAAAQAPSSDYWTLDQRNDEIDIHGPVTFAEGVNGKALVLDGRAVVALRNTASRKISGSGFTASVGFNPYETESGQQMLMGKNRYSLDEREWGLLIEPDGKLRAYLWQNGWTTITSNATLQPGHWHEAALSVKNEKATLFLNGTTAGEVALKKPIPNTAAPITIGGIRDGAASRQEFRGALDDARFVPKALSEKEISDRYEPVTTVHKIPEPPKRFALWDESSPLAKAEELPVLEGVKFHVIKKWDQPHDGYTFLHGVALAWHNNKLYASIGHNKGAENTVTEEAQFRVSEDGGQTWGPLRVIDAGDEPENLAVSHGVFHEHEGTLWAFHGAYYDRMKNIHTRAYSLDEASGEWTHHGVVIEDGFWAMNQPVPMEDGNWIMPGGSFGLYSNDRVFPAAVAICEGNDFTKWKMVSIPADKEIQRMWGESSLFVDGNKVYNIARHGGSANALSARSNDYGRTWSPSEISNLPMATSKPAAGILSTGQRYLVCTTADGNGGKRTPLTIAVSKPGENQFSQVFVIRRSQNSNHPGESADHLSLSYPYAIEHEGKLYVGYSNNGGRKGNLNSAELAVIPVEALATE